MTQNHETSFHLFCSTVNCQLKLKFSEDLDKCGYPSWTKLKIWKGARRLLQVIRERRTSAASAKTCDDLLCVRIIRSPEILFFFSKHRISGFQTPKQHLLHHKLVHPNDWVSWHNPSNIVYVRLRLSAKRILVNYTLWKPNNVVRSGFHSLVIPAGHCPFIQWWGCVHPGQGGTLMWTGSQGGYLWEKETTICELRRGP